MQQRVDFGKEVLPAALSKLSVQALPVRRLLGGHRDHRLVLPRQHGAHAAAPALQPLRRRGARSTPGRASCPARRCSTATSASSVITEGCIVNGATVLDSIVGIRSRIDAGTRLQGVLMLGADFYQGARRAARGQRARLPARGRRRELRSSTAPSSTRTRASGRACASSTRRACSTTTATTTSSATASSSCPRTASSTTGRRSEARRHPLRAPRCPCLTSPWTPVPAARASRSRSTCAPTRPCASGSPATG